MMMEPKEEIRGIVQICHGMAEHKERYEPFMKELCAHGYAAVIHDHRGHGKSVKRQKDLGYFYDETGEAIVEDVHQISLGSKNDIRESRCIYSGTAWDPWWQDVI